MEWLRQYLLSITSAALICAVLRVLVGTKDAAGKIVHFLAAVFLCLSVVSPVLKISVELPMDLAGQLRLQGMQAVSAGEKDAADAMAAVIKERTEAYILDKAASCGLDLKVYLELSEGMPPIPVLVSIQGKCAPYGRQTMSQWLEQELGIGKEAQIWTSESG